MGPFQSDPSVLHSSRSLSQSYSAAKGVLLKTVGTHFSCAMEVASIPLGMPGPLSECSLHPTKSILPPLSYPNLRPCPSQTVAPLTVFLKTRWAITQQCGDALDLGTNYKQISFPQGASQAVCLRWTRSGEWQQSEVQGEEAYATSSS